MNRRKLLRGMITVPVAGALAGCRREPQPAKALRGMLRVILNGPFGVVLESDKDYRITAYVPADPEREHELRFRGPSDLAGSEPKTGKSPSYRFTLGEDGLDIGKGRPRIDQGLYDFYLPHIGNFELPQDPFVAIDLPRPDYITFTPPGQSVFFGGRPTLQPLDHILEYRMTDPDKVLVKSGDKRQPPLPCFELLKQYEEYWSKTKYRSESGEELRRNMEEMLRSCSSSDLCLLFGVGFDPQQPESDPLEHGINFFNKVLLHSFAPNIRKTLQKAVCTPAGSDASHAELIPASLRYPIAPPRILQIASVLDCQSGGVMGNRP